MTTMWRALNQRGLRRVYAQSSKMNITGTLPLLLLMAKS